MPLVSITRLHLRSNWYLPPFIYYALRSARQAKDARGNLRADTMRDSSSAFWTRTVWSDEASMRAYMSAPPHRKAMTKLFNWCDEAHLVHWTQDSPEPPDWKEAHRRLIKEGRTSRVKHPTPAHTTMSIPEPKI